MKRCLWVVECCDDVLGWRPAVEAATTRTNGRINLREWRRQYHERGDKFRLVKYVPVKLIIPTRTIKKEET